MNIDKNELPSLTQLNELEYVERKFMHVTEFREIVGGKIFSAKFVKLNGEIRVIRARLGVTKYLTGGELTYDAASHNNLIVFDLVKKAYRTIKFDNLLEIKYCNKEWSVSEES